MATPQKDSSQHEISIVIVTYNRPGKAMEGVQSLRSHASRYEIIVVDQEHTSGITDAQIREFGITYLDLPRANISQARNAGLKAAQAPIVLFIDDDVEISEDAIHAHLLAYDDAHVVAVAGRVINDGETIPQKTDVETGKTNLLGTQFIQKFWSTKSQLVDFPYGCNMSFRKESLLSIGGFDEAFSRIFDDIDIGLRIKQRGTILFEPKALAYHHKAQAGGSRPEKTHHELLYRNYGYYLGKNIFFPLSVLSLVIRSITVLKESPSLLGLFITFWVRGILRIQYE